MQRLQRIQTQIILIIGFAIILLTAALEFVHVRQQRDALIDAAYQQGVLTATALRESADAVQSVMLALEQASGDQKAIREADLMLTMMHLADDNLSRFVANNAAIRFAALVTPQGSVLVHTNTAMQGLPAADINLVDIPFDRSDRRSVSGYGDVYVTRSRFDVAEPFTPVEYDVVVGVSADAVDDAFQTSITSAVQVMAAVLLLTVIIALLLIRRVITGPLRALDAGANALGDGTLDTRLTPSGSIELRNLARAFNAMAYRLSQAHEKLAQHSLELEATLRAHSRDLEISAQIGRAATRMRDVNTLLNETVHQIWQRFEDIYHAQIFLLDDVQEYAVLVASTGDAGQQLLAFQHKLAVGSDSVIGRVTAQGDVVIASDTLAGDVPWKPNPLLPDTRAEMALPLTIENRVIGALDVQSIAPDVFTGDMIATFRVLADQLAIAIENARLLEETEERIHQIDTLNQQLTQTTWQQYLTEQRSDRPIGYVYDRVQTAPLDDDLRVESGIHLTEIPIRVHDEPIGTLVTTAASHERLSNDDQRLVEAVAERVALAIENARLFEQTQRALAETERLYETARTVSSAPDLDAIFQIVVEQLGAGTHVDDIEILLSGPDPMLVQYLDSVYLWNRHNRVDVPEVRSRLSVPPLTYTNDDVLPVSAPETHADIRDTLPAEHPLFPRLTTKQARSVILAPITASGRWFGLLLCSAKAAHRFNAASVGFAGALADQLALAIENRRLFDEAQTEARRARALAEAGQLASQIGGDYETGLANLFQAVSGPGNYDRWWFGLMNSDYTHLNQIIAHRITTPDSLNVQQAQYTIAEAARIGQIVLVNDPDDFTQPGEKQSVAPDSWGKHITMPVRIQDEVVGVLLIGRGLDDQNLDERDIQLAATLASQIAVATQNQTLFTEAETQRLRLQTIVDTMPTGILVMDKTGHVVLSNQNLLTLLGPDMRPGGLEYPAPYPIIDANAKAPYPREEWPLNRVLETGEPSSADDMVVIQPDGSTVSIMAQAAPIFDQHGNVSAVVGAFQDITTLQNLERALHDSLRETTMLYEAGRAISRVMGLSDLLPTIIKHVGPNKPDQAYLFLVNRDQRTPSAPAVLAASYPSAHDPVLTSSTFASLFVDTPRLVTRADRDATNTTCLDHTGLAAAGSYPLSVRGYVSGWIVFGYQTVETISAEQSRFIATLVDQAAVTIENQQLLTQTAQALEETAILYRASRDMSDANTASEILRAFAESIMSHRVTYAALYTLLGESVSVSYAAIELAAAMCEHPHADPAGTRYRIDEFPFWAEIHEQEIVAFEDISQLAHPDADAITDLQSLDVQSLMIIPLQTGESTLGGIILGTNTSWTATDNEIRTAEALADQAAVALENTRLYQQTQRRARQLATSAQISRAVTSILRLDDLLPQVVNQIREGFDYDHAQVFLISADGQRATLVASTGDIGQALLKRGHYLEVGSRSVIGQVTALGEPQIALDTADARVAHRPNPLLPHTRSEMALPLIARGQILGALDVQSNISGAFTDEDIRVLTALADMVATAITNARLFELAEERAVEMEFLFTITTAAASSSNLDESLEQVVYAIRNTMQATNVSIHLPNELGDKLTKGATTGNYETGDDETAITTDRGLIGWVARHREPLNIGDLSRDPRRLNTIDETQSVIALPLITGGTLSGVLTVESDQLNAFRKNDLRLLQTLSSSLAAIIQNSRLLREMQLVNEQLLEVDRLKTNFLAAMSHELRTPLNSIIGFSRVILKGIDGPLTDTQEQDLNTIYESGKHLLGLVNDILDQAKIEAGKMELSFDYFKLQDVIKGVMSSAVGLTREKPIRLYTEIEGELPDAYGDEFRTRQVLLNLISNAAKFTEEGSITLSAFPVESNGYQYIQISVTDTGIGIAKKDMHKLFEAFQQVDNSLTRRVGGTGMGLPLARSFTELQHGQMWVESEPGVGSTFSITVPTEPIPDDEAGAEPEDSTLRPQTVRISPETVRKLRAEAMLDSTGTSLEDLQAEEPQPPTKTALVIEDNEGVIGFYKRYLTPAGYQVVGVTDATSVRFTLAVRPNIILLDVNMKNGAGWKVLEELRDIANAPVIVCSMNQDRERGLALGAAEYILKPFSQDQLIGVVRRIEMLHDRQRILLVDDQPQSIRAFRETLAEHPEYDVIEATSGEEALTIINQPEPVDLVILDLRMPGIDGFDILQSLRANHHTAHVPVLVLTAEDLTAAERERLQSIDVFRKDALDGEELVAQVAARLDSKEENKQV